MRIKVALFFILKYGYHFLQIGEENAEILKNKQTSKYHHFVCILILNSLHQKYMLYLTLYVLRC